jgi:adenylate cyclase
MEVLLRWLLRGRCVARARVNIQLVDQISGKHLWAERFDGSIEDAFDLQDRLVEQASIALQVGLSDGAQVEL